MHFVANDPNSNTPNNLPSSMAALPKPMVGQALAKNTLAKTAATHGKPVAADSSAASGDNNNNNNNYVKKTEHGKLN